ncbi:DUF2972 domain-containing protein, partial [Campylobacter insulaenigrae]|uniref:DUF2972 domain-containing protein n=1 Tax=Campylobacter insulaenigrae TaxID=260714 RepID=UPI002152F99F
MFKSSNMALKNPTIYYINKYQEINYLQNNKNILIIEHGLEKHHDGLKLFNLILLNKDVYILTRDPLSRLKTWANHIIDDYISPDTEFDIGFDFSQGVKWIKYAFGGEKVDLNYFIYSGPITNEAMSIDSFVSNLNYNKVFYIDFNEIYPKGILDLFTYFKNKYNFPVIQNTDFFQYNLGGSVGYLFAHSRILKISENHNNYKFKIFFCSSLRLFFIKNKNIDITYSLFPIHNDMQNEFIDVSKYFCDKEIPKDFFMMMSQAEFEKLYQNFDLLNQVKNYIKDLLENIYNQINLEDEKKINENDILLFFENNDFYRKELKA